MAEFKFNIGDVVIHKTAAVNVRCIAGTDKPVLGTVVERLTQECHGGVQIPYRVRWGLGGTAQDIPFIYEYELVHYVEWLASLPPEQTAMDALQAAKEIAVAELDYDLAREIRALCDRMKDRAKP